MVSGIYLLTCGLLVGSAFALASPSENEQEEKKLYGMTETSSGHNGTVRAEQKTTETELQTELWAVKRELRAIKGELLATRTERQISNEENAELTRNTGATYVHWGKSNCTSDSNLVYSGHIAGKAFDKKGLGTNVLCLTSKPPSVHQGDTDERLV